MSARPAARRGCVRRTGGCAGSPRHEMGGGGEPGHVQPHLGDDRLGAVASDAADLIQAVDCGQHRGARTLAGDWTGGAVGVDALGGGDRGDQLLDPGASRPAAPGRADGCPGPDGKPRP